MDEDHGRRIGAFGLIDIELFDFGRPIGYTGRLVDQRLGDLIVERTPFFDGFVVEGVDIVVIGVVEFGLVQIHPDERAFGAFGWDFRAALGGSAVGCGRKGSGRCAGDQCTAR